MLISLFICLAQVAYSTLCLIWFSFRFGSVREKLDDPAYSGFFLKFDKQLKSKYHVPQCDTNYSPPKCSEFYHDQEQSPGHPKGDGSCTDNCDCGQNPCGEYLVCKQPGVHPRIARAGMIY
jgi:hypothetical protein